MYYRFRIALCFGGLVISMSLGGFEQVNLSGTLIPKTCHITTPASFELGTVAYDELSSDPQTSVMIEDTMPITIDCVARVNLLVTFTSNITADVIDSNGTKMNNVGWIKNTEEIPLVNQEGYVNALVTFQMKSNYRYVYVDFPSFNIFRSNIVNFTNNMHPSWPMGLRLRLTDTKRFNETLTASYKILKSAINPATGAKLTGNVTAVIIYL